MRSTSAIAWAREHAPEYGADPSTLVVAGSSAGAHLASIAALTPNDPDLQPGLDSADTSVSAALCLYGYHGYYYGSGPTDVPHSSPMAYVHPGAPPILIVHGNQDTCVSVEGARSFARRLGALNAPVLYRAPRRPARVRPVPIAAM